jgi:1-acyl-sn-glycerol-3-phosphate acyltransferase
MRRFGAWRALVTHVWARAATRVIGMHVRLQGEPGREPCLVVANHLSYVDVVLLASVQRCSFVAKSEVARWPVLGWFARTMGTVFVERGEKRDLLRLAQDLRALLAAGRRVVLFPEGTSSGGEAVHPFHASLLAPAVELGLPVRYAAIRYETPPGEPPAELAVCWWGDMTFVRHFLSLLRLPGFEAELFLGEEALLDSDRKRLARRLHVAVSERLRLQPRIHHA